MMDRGQGGFRSAIVMILKKHAWLPCLFGIAALAALAACAGRRCDVCQRDLHPGMGAELTLASGEVVSTCCIRCALHHEEKPGAPARMFRVVDHAGDGFIEAASAYLVEGSDVNLCVLAPPRDEETRIPMQLAYDRCASSIIAFSREQDAQAFAAEHGGTLRPPGYLTDRGTLSH